MIDPLGIKKNDPLGLKKKVASKPISQKELWGSSSQPEDLYTSLVTGAQEDQQASDTSDGPPKMKEFTGLTPEEQQTLQAKPVTKVSKSVDLINKRLKLQNELSKTKVTPENQAEISRKTDELSSIAKEQDKINKTRLSELEQQFKSSKDETYANTEAENRLNNLITNTGVWNNVKSKSIDVYNSVVDELSALTDEVGIKELKANTDPLSEEKNEVIKDALKKKVRLNENQINEAAKKLYKDKQVGYIETDRINSFLDNLDDEDKNLLKQDRYNRSVHLQENNAKQEKIINAYEVVGNKKINEYQNIEKELLKFKSQNKEISKDLYESYLNLGFEIKGISNDISKRQKLLQKNKEDLGTVNEEFDFFKRQYGDVENFLLNTGTMARKLAVNTFGGLDYLGSLGGIIDPEGKNIGVQKDVIRINAEIDAQRDNLRKSVDSVESAEGFVNYVSDIMSNQMPSLVATSTGAGGLATIGVSTAGEKYADMNKEVLEGKATYSPLQMAAVPFLYGATEVVSEIPTLSILKKGGRLLESITKNEADLITKSVKQKAKEWAKDWSVDTGKEIAGEEFTNFAQNFTNKYILGKKDVGLLDNTGTVLKDTFTLTSILKAAPHVAGAILKPHQTNTDLLILDENSRKIMEFSNQIDSNVLSDKEKAVVTKQMNKLVAKNSEIIANTIDKVDNMPVDVYNKVIELNDKAANIKSEAVTINDGVLPNKNDLLKELSIEYKSVRDQRNALLNIEYQAPEIVVEEAASAVEVVKPTVVEPTITTEVAPTPSGQKVTDIINRPATLESQAGVKLETPIEGDVYQEGQRIIFEDKNKKTYDLGNIDEVSDKTVEELGIKPQEEMVSLTPEGKIKVGDNQWTMQPELPNYGIEYDKDGNVKAVSLKDDAGKTVMYEGQVAEDAAYQVLLKQTETPEQRQAINEILENDEELNRQLREAEKTAEETAAEVTEPGAPKTQAEQYSEELDQTKADNPEDYWSVSPVSVEDAAKGTIIDTPDGAAIVKPDGDIAGLFKKATSKAKGVAQDLLKRAIAAGGKKLDNYDTYLTPQYIKAGFRVVSRTPFNEKYAPPGWNKELHGTPDVVAMIYDPENKLDIEEKTFNNPDTGYDEAIAYRDSLLEIEAELEGLTKLFDDSDKGFRMSQVDNAKEALKGILPGVEFIVHETDDAFNKATGDSRSGGVYIYRPGTDDTPPSRVIHINKQYANGRTVAHEVFHAVILDKIKGEKRVQEITARMVKAVYKTASPKLRADLDAFAARYSDKTIRDEERLSELIGIIADGYPQMSQINKGIVKRWLESLAKMFRIKPFTDNEVIDLLNTLARKVSTGEVISAEDVSILGPSKEIVKKDIKRFQNDFVDPVSKVEFVYDKNTDTFKELEKEGYITKNKSIRDFNGKIIFLHQPDGAFSGLIYKNGELLVEGKGGVYYPIKFHKDGYFWASTSTTAKKMAKDLNKVYDANNGQILMALTSAPYDKLLSSTTAANGVMEIMLSKAFDKNFSINKEQIKRALIDAANKTTIIDGKNLGLGLKIKKGSTLEEVKSEIAEKLGPDNSVFGDRKMFSESLISNVADIIKNNPKAVEQFNNFFREGVKDKQFKGTKTKGSNLIKISKTNLTRAISEMLTEPMLKEGVDRYKGGQVYAILELNGKVKPIDSNKHESYPKAIQSEDLANKVKLHILTDRVKWNDVFEDPETGDIVSEDRTKRIYPTSGVSTTGLKLNTKNLPAEDNTIIRKQIVGENANLSQNVRDNLDVARDMESSKKSDKEIRLATGWERGTDKKWRYEVPDNIPFLKDTVKTVGVFLSEDKDTNQLSQKANYFLPKELLDLYPQLNDITIKFDKVGDESEGSYDPTTKTIEVSIGIYPSSTVSSLIHEVQHAIQEIEGFAEGGSLSSSAKLAILSLEKKLGKRIEKTTRDEMVSLKLNKKEENFRTFILNSFYKAKNQKQLLKLIDKESYSVYRKLVGEVESRNVERRMNATPEERRKTTLKESEDVASEDQIIFFKRSQLQEPVKNIPAGNRLFNKPLPEAKEIADNYYKKTFGKDRVEFKGTRELDKENAKRISDAFIAMKHDPNNPKVKASYRAMAIETLNQYKYFLKSGYKIEINNEEPYSNSEAVIEDLRNNKRIKIFSTESGFGDNPITAKERSENPLLKDSGYKDANGQPLLINDVFRAVHDFFGHAELGNSFGPLGEENAWNVHARMYSDLAKGAVTTETRGQNSYVNFSGVNKEIDLLREKARKFREEGNIEEADKITNEIYEKGKFADQKIGLLPEEFSKFPEDKTIERLQQAKSIDEIVRIAKEAKYSDAAISSFLKAKGFSNIQITNAMSKTTITEDEAYDKFNAEFKKSREEITNKKTVKEYIKQKYQNIIKNWSNRQVEAQSLLSKTGMVNTLNLSINSHGYSGKAKRLFEKSYDKIYKGLSTEKRDTLDKVIQAKRFIAIDNNRAERGLDPVKHPNYINKQESQMYLDKLKQEIGDKAFNDITARADEYFSTYKKLLKDVYENGLISKEAYDSMSDVDYQPRVFLQFVTDFEGDLKTAKNSVDSTSLSSDQIKSMKEGDVNSLVTNSEWLLSNSLVARTNAMAKNNINRRFMTDEFPKAKERFDKLDPKNLKGDDKRFYEYFKELQSKVIDNPIIGYTKEGNPKYKYDDLKSPLNFTKAYYYIDGVQHQFFLEDGLHKSWNDNVDGFLSRDAKELISYASGSALVKAIATGNNPAFPIVNTPRDLMFTAAFSDEYSNFIPASLVQISADVIKSIREIGKKESDLLNKYYEYGGAMDFLSSQGRLKKDSLLGSFTDKMVPANVKDKAKGFFNTVTLKKISEYSELMFRLGIFQRSINNSLKELGIRSMSEITEKQQADDIYNSAVASARGILDFNKGGVAAKDLESLVPYINVAFQGGSVALNAFKKNPVATTSRIFQIATIASTIPAGLSLFLIAASKRDDDEDKTAHEIYLDAMAGVSKYQKSKYMNIVTGEKNEDGQYRVIKIAKAQELSPIISVTDDITENMIRQVAGKEPKSNETIVKNAMFSLNNNVLPFDVTSPSGTIVRNPLAKAILTYQTGYDFFRDQPLAMGLEDKPAPYEGLDMKSVEGFYKDLGPKYGFSPVRSKAFVESLITTPDTNPFIGMLYGGAEAMSSNKDAKDVGENLVKNIYKSTGKRVVSYTSDFNRNLEAKQKLEKQIDEVKLKDAILKSNIKLASDRFIAKDITKDQLMDEFKDLDPFDKKRAIMKIRDKKMMKDVESNIIDIKYEKSARVKALMIQNYYGNILDKSDDSKEIIIQMKKAGNILTPEVIYELKNAQ